MKKYFIPVTLTVLFLLNCGGLKELTTQAYVDPVYNFTVTVPEQWRSHTGTGKMRVKSVDTQYTRSKERTESLIMNAGIEIDPTIYLLVETGNKDIKEYINNLKKSYITEFFNLFSKDTYKESREIEEKTITLWGSQEAYEIEIKEGHADPTRRNPITQVYGYDINTIIWFTIFKKGENIFRIEFICPEMSLRQYAKNYKDFVSSFKFK